jgi:peptidoglycan/xylan/chitin deacetylase (PgdA/CDA1 family)
MYHSVDVPPLFHQLRGLYVTPQRLDRHLCELQSAKIDFTTLGEWNRQRTTTRQVALTFDDAYRSLFTKGLPVLQKRAVKAMTYVVANLIGKTNQWDDGKGLRTEPLMNRDELGEWLRAGNEIGAHSLNHPDLTTLPLDEARREIVDSKKILEDMFGRPVRHFCYPYGAQNETIRALVQEAGYETATSTIRGVNAPDADTFALRRLLATHRRPYLAALFRR